MATQRVLSPQPGSRLAPYYYAKAYVLKADLEQPLERKIEPQAAVELPQDGGYEFREFGPYRLEGVLSYRYGYTQVAGHPSSKKHGNNTLATSVVEDLNVLDVVTADRVVGQISTDYPGDDEVVQVPRVTFLGTRFVNLRIGGHKVDIDQDIHVLGAKPRGEVSYFEDAGALTRMSRQFAHIRKMKKLPEWAAKEFTRDKTAIQQDNTAQMSLVNSINGAPGAAFGHVIDVPHFGRIYLGELTIDRKLEPGSTDYYLYTFHLEMIRLDMGCIGKGTSGIVAMDANGKGGKGGP
jgi:hypothetical protein